MHCLLVSLGGGGPRQALRVRAVALPARAKEGKMSQGPGVPFSEHGDLGHSLESVKSVIASNTAALKTQPSSPLAGTCLLVPGPSGHAPATGGFGLGIRLLPPRICYVTCGSYLASLHYLSFPYL